jgi:hypothetical protein
MLIMDFAIQVGISSGIFPEPPRLSAIISSEISNLLGSSAIEIFIKKN